MNGPVGVDWTAALLVLAAGLVVGTVLVWKMLGRARAEKKPTLAGNEALERRDLAGKRDALIGQLRELEDTASKRTPEQWAQERYALELEAARTLLALEARGSLGAAAAVPAPSAEAGTPSAVPVAPPPSPQAGMRGFLWGLGSAGAIGLLVFLLYSQARPRPEGGSLTGDIGASSAMSRRAPDAPGSPPEAAAPGPEEAALRDRVASHPDDLAARMDLARAALARQDMMGVWNETKAVLEQSPGHAQAMAYQALVRLAMGQGDKALELLEQALRKDPDLLDAYVHLALVHVRLGQVGDAEKAIAEATRRFPTQGPALQRLLADLKQGATARADAAASGEGDPHAGLEAPPSAGAAAPTRSAAARAAAGPAAKSISGTVELDPALAGQVGAGGILFVFVREAGFGAGPPLAARRLPVTSFPVAFEIGEADAMMGQAFPNDLLVEARLDADGDPTTRPPTDPKARLDDVKTGSKGVKLVLKRAS